MFIHFVNSTNADFREYHINPDVFTYENLMSLDILKLYCGYKHTRHCMITCNRNWVLKQLWLHANGHA